MFNDNFGIISSDIKMVSCGTVTVSKEDAFEMNLEG